MNTNNITRIFAFSNQKGGVGKTTTTLAVAAGLSKKGFKTLLIDIDPQGNATSGVGIDKNSQEKTIYHCLHDNVQLSDAIQKTQFENLYLLPANSSLAGAELELSHIEEREYILSKLLKNLKDQYDFILIDSPPSLGLLTINALVAARKLIIPLQCEYYSLEGLGDLLRIFTLIKSKLNPSLDIGGVILTMADFRAKVTLQVIEEVKSHFNDQVFKTVIPRSVRISEAPSHGMPIVCYDSSSKGALAYLSIVDELLEKEGLQERHQDTRTSEHQEKNEEPKRTTQPESVVTENEAETDEPERIIEPEPNEEEFENEKIETTEQPEEKEEVKAFFERKIQLDERLLKSSEENENLEQENENEAVEEVSET